MFKRSTASTQHSRLGTPSKSLAKEMKTMLPVNWSVGQYFSLFMMALIVGIGLGYIGGALMKSSSWSAPATEESNIAQTRWYWKDDYGQWELYRPDICDTLEASYHAWKRYDGPSTLLTFVGRHSHSEGRWSPQKYLLDLEAMKQTNANTGHSRPIYRKAGTWVFETAPHEKLQHPQPYLPAQQELLEEAYNRWLHMGGDQTAAFNILVEGKMNSYQVDFKQETQTNTASRHSRGVRRIYE